MSSKFNTHPRPMLRPSICKAPHGSCWPPWPIDQPLLLHAYLDLWDLDPADPIGGAGYALLNMIDPAPTWTGVSPPGATQVGAAIGPAAAPNFWNVTATLFPPDHASATWLWNDVYINPTKNFDTRLLQQLVLPGLDYQNVRIMT